MTFNAALVCRGDDDDAHKTQQQEQKTPTPCI